MATLPIKISTPNAALVPATEAQAAITGGDDFPNDGHILLYIEGGSAGLTLTIDSIPNKTYTLAATTNYLIGPFPPAEYNDGTGKVRLTYSAVTSVKVAAIRSL